MKKIIAVSIIAFALAIAGCSGTGKKTSSPLDTQWAGKSKTYASKKFYKPMKWSPGQYTVTGTIKDGDRESVARFLIVRREGGGWVIETTTTNDEGKKSGMQMLIKGYEKAQKTGDASSIEVVWMKVLQEDGTVQKVENEALFMYNMTLKATWNNLIQLNLKYKTGGAVKVPAGTFSGTSRVDSSVKILFSTFNQTSWMHPDVPVNGVVKTSTDDIVTELIDFGFNGKPVIK